MGIVTYIFPTRITIYFRVFSCYEVLKMYRIWVTIMSLVGKMYPYPYLVRHIEDISEKCEGKYF